MGLDDRDALRVLHDAFAVPSDGTGVVAQFFTRWFGTDPSVRDLFPADLTTQRAAFAHAMSWVLGEFIAQRAQEPVTLLAQLGRDHRKYGVTQRHYAVVGRVLLATLRDELADRWTAAVDAAASEALNLIIGVMGGAADAEEGPAWWDGTVVEHLRVSRDIAVVRIQLDQPLPYHPGQYVKVEVPQCPRSTRPGPSNFTSARSLPVWSAPRSSTNPGPAIDGDCPAPTAACTSIAMPVTC